MTIRLVGVFAHPDDDVYSIGGSLLLHAGEVEPTLIFATSGGAGPISDAPGVTRETLASVREGEQHACMEILGYPDARVEWLRHPDYYLPEVPEETLSTQIGSVFEEIQPHVAITFGPDGLTSHHDHIYVGRVATEVFHELRTSSSDPNAFQRLYHIALARSDVDRFYSVVAEGGYEYGEEGTLFDITGVPDDRIAVRADVRSVADRTREGILAHRTQLIEWERIPEPLRGIFLETECFVQAHPRRGPGSAPRTDLFDDLEVGSGATEPAGRASQ
jgi:N-acetyl-1-D-myo-inositol-2-amino-2-deoxy-alpha-D-glucopyranoside deacetylase